MGQPRVFYSMSKDGLLPSWAAKIHPKYQTPHITTAITGTIVAILAGFVPISLLGELVSIGTLFAFVIVGTGIIILRSSNPALNRPFKVPLVPFFMEKVALRSDLMQSDGLHPTAAAQPLLLDTVWPALRPLLGAAAVACASAAGASSCTAVSVAAAVSALDAGSATGSEAITAAGTALTGQG